MTELKENDIKLFEQIASLNQSSLMKTMYKFLKKHYKKVVYTRDYVYAVGDDPVALVAHLDTVFPKSPKNIYYDKEQGVMWSPQGLGADDRAGVFAIIKIIKAGFKPSIIFTVDEEKGGIGAIYLSVSETTCPFPNLKYLIQLDRCGTNDCVFYDCDNKPFVDYIEKFGFIENIGSFSDISELCPSWKLAGVNLSIGYQNEHSVSETLHIAPLTATIEKVKLMIKDSHNLKEPFKFIPSKWFYKYTSYYGTGEAHQDIILEDDDVYCDKCGNCFSSYEVFKVKGLDGKTKTYCPDCIVDNVQWCSYCQEPFEIDPANPEESVCRDCRKLISFRG